MYSKGISIGFKIKHLLHYLRKGKIKELYNYTWIYALWWSDPLRRIILNKFLPFLKIDLYPPFIEIEPTTFCNLKCIMCEHTYWNEPQRNMAFEEFKEIVDQFPKLKWAGMTGIGSNFLNKDYLKMLEYLKSRSVLVEVIDEFNPPVNKGILKKLIEIEPDILWTSIYGWSKKTYENVAVGGNFSKVVENIKTFVQLRKEMNTRLPIYNFHYIITKPNLGEIPKFLEFVHSLDADIGEVLFTPLLHTFNEVKDIVVTLKEEDMRSIEKKAEELGVSIDYNLSVPIGGQPPINHCVEYIMPFIFVTGHVINCCCNNEGNRRDWQKETSFGNAFEQPFREIWYSKRYKRMRELIREGKVPKECVYCPIYDVKPK